MKLVRWAPLVPVFACFLVALPAHAGLVIDPIFDSSITINLNAAIIESTINSAISTYENLFANPVTVKIYFQEGGGLGASNAFSISWCYGVPCNDGGALYPSFYSQLMATNANPAAFAELNTNGGNSPVNPVTGTDFIDVKSANMRALGITDPVDQPGCVPTATGLSSDPYTCNSTFQPGAANAVDGIITLNTSATDPPGPNNGSKYGLLSVAEHEIDEVLGLGSSLPNCNPSATNPPPTMACKNATNWTFASDSPLSSPAPEDLYRWTVGGTRSTGTNCQTPSSAYFSYGPSSGEIAQFNNSCNGEDFGDWMKGASPQTQDAIGTTGANPTVGTAEIDALRAIGYEETPEPGTCGLLLSALAALAIAARRAA